MNANSPASPAGSGPPEPSNPPAAAPTATTAPPSANASSASAPAAPIAPPSAAPLLPSRPPASQAPSLLPGSAALSSPASSSPTLTLFCPICGTYLSYPPGVQFIQCPSCQNQLDTTAANSHHMNLAQLGMMTAPQQFQQLSQSVHSQPQTRCVGCAALLAYPPASLFVQCPQCGRTQDPRQNQFHFPQQLGGLSQLSLLNQQQLAALQHSQAASLKRGDSFAKAPVATKSAKKRKDPQAPKAVRNAYMIFCQLEREKLKEANPDFSFGKLGGRLGEMWRHMSADEKKPYERLAMEDRERYRAEMLRWQQFGSIQGDGQNAQAQQNKKAKKEPAVEKPRKEESEDGGDSEDSEEYSSVSSQGSRGAALLEAAEAGRTANE